MMRLLLFLLAVSVVSASPKLSTKEKQALLGAYGIPSGLNCLVTDSDPRLALPLGSTYGPSSTFDGYLAVFDGVTGTGFDDLPMTTDSLLGRDTVGTGIPEMITLGSDLTINGGVLDVVDSALALGFSQVASITTDSLVGRDTDGTGAGELITLSSDLSIAAAVLGVNDASLSISFSQINNVTTDSILGRDTAGTGAAEMLTLNSDLAIASAVLGVMDANLTIARSQIGTVDTDSIIGRDTAGTGAAETITLDGDLEIVAGVLGVKESGLSLAYSQLSNIATNSVVARDTAGTGVAENPAISTTRPTSQLVLTSNVLSYDPQQATGNEVIGNVVGANIQRPTASAGYVIPMLVERHAGIVHSWCHANAAGAVVGASYNISSLTDNGTGDLTVTTTTSHDRHQWSKGTAEASSHLCISATYVNNINTRYYCFNNATTLTDPTSWYVATSKD